MTPFELFEVTAGRHPGQIALEVGETTMTYRQLHAAVEETAGRLVAVHGGRPRRIGLLATRRPLAYAGYLAALRLGAAVVPLNPAFPAARNRAVAGLAEVDVLVVQDDATLPEGPWTVLREGDRTAPAALPAYAGSADDLAYILFTSGSTGTPKGVPIQNANLLPYLRYNLDRYQVGPGCRLSQTFDLTFDPSVFDMFMAWCSGAALVVPGREEVSAPVDFVNDRGITHWFSVPSVVSLARRMRRLPAGSMPGLRLSLFAGEQLTRQQAEAWRAAAPASVLENIYGPTELTITCTGYRLPAQDLPDTENGTAPIGRPYPGVEHVVLDDELCVRGPQRFGGYLDPADNTGRFLSWRPGERPRPYDGGEPLGDRHWYRTGDRVREDPEHGLVHLGRLDNQVKIHGYRVELGEIEALLREDPAVQDAVAVVQADDLKVLYTGTEVPAGRLAGLVSARLPRYMVPSQYRWLRELPLNSNGKVDRARLAKQAG